MESTVTRLFRNIIYRKRNIYILNSPICIRNIQSVNLIASKPDLVKEQSVLAPPG